MGHSLRRNFKPGDHVCAIYSSSAELAELVAGFLVEGLQYDERCWYVAARNEAPLVDAALRKRGVKVDAEIRCGALAILSGSGAYLVQGAFNPETTVRTFSDAIEAALDDGFRGFRAAADMSWVLDVEDGAEQVMTYEALLRSLFATSRATGLCLYHRNRMPLRVLKGALVRHPITRVHRKFTPNPLFGTAVVPTRRDTVITNLRSLRKARHLCKGC